MVFIDEKVLVKVIVYVLRQVLECAEYTVFFTHGRSSKSAQVSIKLMILKLFERSLFFLLLNYSGGKRACCIKKVFLEVRNRVNPVFRLNAQALESG